MTEAAIIDVRTLGGAKENLPGLTKGAPHFREFNVLLLFNSRIGI